MGGHHSSKCLCLARVRFALCSSDYPMSWSELQRQLRMSYPELTSHNFSLEFLYCRPFLVKARHYILKRNITLLLSENQRKADDTS